MSTKNPETSVCAHACVYARNSFNFFGHVARPVSLGSLTRGFSLATRKRLVAKGRHEYRSDQPILLGHNEIGFVAKWLLIGTEGHGGTAQLTARDVSGGLPLAAGAPASNEAGARRESGQHRVANGNRIAAPCTPALWRAACPGSAGCPR